MLGESLGAVPERGSEEKGFMISLVVMGHRGRPLPGAMRSGVCMGR